MISRQKGGNASKGQLVPFLKLKRRQFFYFKEVKLKQAGAELGEAQPRLVLIYIHFDLIQSGILLFNQVKVKFDFSVWLKCGFMVGFLD